MAAKKKKAAPKESDKPVIDQNWPEANAKGLKVDVRLYRGRAVIRFNQPISWLAMSKTQAHALARAIYKTADLLPGE